ncbi:antibiotic biosynthesis monooxygenase [Puniceicoccus vermicola]|uniref:Antibiotic biosynthesis monooxygenase n=1 Tax=Puniceicoccus vermicola TaxID=388746 RepID=A0A7X1AW76_9BACT|nr:antibiotic biosynthesis monooxygenase [Puniceicoccus vermicola]MBC2601133.1 antibiotic biosynthesis monooxygenase [Puniceicoccus vermicola]
MKNSPEPGHLKSHVTLVISHRVSEEVSREFARLQDELARKLKTFEGFLGLETSSPEGGRQEEWVIVYRFQHAGALEKWMESPQRKKIVEKIRELTGQEGSIQILVEPQNKESVTTVFAHRIKKGCEEDYRNWRARIIEAQRAFDGFLGVESFDPIEGVSDQWVDIGHFTNAESRIAWMESEERKRLVRELEPLAEDVSVKSVSSGLDAWFRSGSGEQSEETPPVWKQALSILLALYPIVMLLTFYFNPLFGSISLPLMMLIGNAVSVSLLSWFVMKWVNRLLGFWLLPKRKSLALDIGGAVGIFILLAIMLFLFERFDPLPMK